MIACSTCKLVVVCRLAVGKLGLHHRKILLIG